MVLWVTCGACAMKVAEQGWSVCVGDGLVVSSKGPGIFLQGLAVHGKDGTLLPGENILHVPLPLKKLSKGCK